MANKPRRPTDQVTLYTDGGCIRNPGPGGFAVVLLAGGRRKELSGGYYRTTNNRMEIMAVIAGLEALRRPCTVQVYSDSQYVVNAMRYGWAKRWKANRWMRTEDEPALNADLWQRVLELCTRHRVSFSWVKGHGKNVENNRCDTLARGAATRSGLMRDEGYEANSARCVTRTWEVDDTAAAVISMADNYVRGRDRDRRPRHDRRKGRR
jgi:ribonuclease HI